jgi:hypothetical protein
MKIYIRCQCGRSGNVAASMAGKTIKCPSCGADVFVLPGPAAGAAKADPKLNKKATPVVYMSAGKVIGLSVLIIGIISIILFVKGPVAVWHQWDAIGGNAEDQVKDVIAFGLQAYLSQVGDYNPNTGRNMPSVDGDVQFIRPLLTMSMPEKIKFSGKSNQGDFEGYYHPATGEIEADVTYGGRTVAGMVDLIKATGGFHLTGREVPGKPISAEANGKPIAIYYPPKIEGERG